MTSKLCLLLLSLSLIGTYKPVKADPYAVTMFALPFVGAIFGQAMRNNKSSSGDMEGFEYNIRNLNYIPIGGCKVFKQYDKLGALTEGVACKEPDGSWKVDTTGQID